MLKSILCFIIYFLIGMTSSFKLLPMKVVFPKIIEICPRIHENLILDTLRVSESLTIEGFPVEIFSHNMNATGSICNEDFDGYGQTGVSDFTKIKISNKLLNYPNTLHNVVLHEILHSLGLDHSDDDGMMKYAVRLNWWGGVIEDDRKLWIGLDDLKGLLTVKNLI